MSPDLRVEPLHLQTAVSLLVDDPAPCINPYYYHRRLRQTEGEPTLASGERVARSIPLSFLHRFVDTVEAYGLRGKFSVVPYPCNLGWVGRGLEGYPESECREWVRTVRERLAPCMDVCPEMITHLYAVDTETLRPLAEDEHAWSQHQDEETLTRYVARALRLLADAGIDATGVTSPWMFGERVEPAYARAIANAQKQVYGRRLTWYFLRSDPLSPWVPPVIAAGDPAAGEAVVHIRPAAGDPYWRTQDTVEAGQAYVGSVVDPLISGDLSRGRIPALVTAGSVVALLTHWQSLYAQGRTTGLEALAETARRLAAAYGPRLAWRSCLELASWTAAAAALRWAIARENAVLRVSLESPIPCGGFTVSLACEGRPRRVAAAPSGAGAAGGGMGELPFSPAGRLPLPGGHWTWVGGRLAVCLDLAGPVQLEAEL